MNNFINNSKKNGFFEGWYFKHQAENNIIAFIPGFNTDGEGTSQAFLQIIMNENSYLIPYSIKDFSIDRKKLIIRLGNNSFSRRGIKINVKTEEISMTGKLRYGRILPIRNTIMGFFKFLPGMECKHEIISMYHRIYGEFALNGVKYPFYPGIGYIEKDLGHSFPKSYLWAQCNSFPGESCSVFLSIADIPYHGMNFKGCICAIIYQGKEYRLATYKGVKVVSSSPKEICLKQGRYLLKIYLNTKPDGNKTNSKVEGNNTTGSRQEYNNTVRDKAEGYIGEGYKAENYQGESYQGESHKAERYQGESHKVESYQRDSYEAECYQGESYRSENYKPDSYQPEDNQPGDNNPKGNNIKEYKLTRNITSSDTKEESFRGEQEFSQELYAPVMGGMTKKIKEQHLSVGRFVLYDRKKLIFDLKSPYVSYEYVE